MKREEFTGLLRAVADALERMSDKDYRDLLRGDGHLEYLPAGSSKPQGGSNREDRAKYPDNLPEQLQAATSREQGREMLSSLGKDALVSLARHFTIRVSKGARQDEVIEKIVGSVVGARLKTEAIRDVDLKGT